MSSALTRISFPGRDDPDDFFAIFRAPIEVRSLTVTVLCRNRTARVSERTNERLEARCQPSGMLTAYQSNRTLSARESSNRQRHEIRRGSVDL